MGQRDPHVGACMDRSAQFAQLILAHVRELVHAACPDCEEALKWSAPGFKAIEWMAGGKRRNWKYENC
jgi:hypothetical protein